MSRTSMEKERSGLLKPRRRTPNLREAILFPRDVARLKP